MTMAEAGARFLVSGRVQGVCFRATTQERASQLGLRGHARNLDDGRVEVVALGPSDRLRKLAAWLSAGPPAARVDAVWREDLASADLGDARLGDPGDFAVL